MTFLNEKLKLTGVLNLRGDETKPQVVTLQPWGVLEGRVVDADGEPLVESSCTGFDRFDHGSPNSARMADSASNAWSPASRMNCSSLATCGIRAQS